MQPTRYFGAEARVGKKMTARKGRRAEYEQRGTAGKWQQRGDFEYPLEVEGRGRFARTSMLLSGVSTAPGWQNDAVLIASALCSAPNHSSSEHMHRRFPRLIRAGFRACILDSAGILGVIRHDLKASALRLRRSNSVPRQKYQKSRAFFDLGVYSAGVWE